MGAHPTGRNAGVTPLPEGILLSFCTSLGSLFGPVPPAMAQVVAGDVLVGSRRRGRALRDHGRNKRSLSRIARGRAAIRSHRRVRVARAWRWEAS